MIHSDNFIHEFLGWHHDKKDVDATIKAMKEAGDEAFVVGYVEAGEKGVTLC